MKRFAITLAAFTAVVVACSSSSDDSGGAPTDTPDSGASSSGSSGTSSGSSGTSSGSSGTPMDASAEDAADAANVDAGPFTLTSTDMTNGGSFKDMNTCTVMNVSPAFAWTGAPAGAKSFAIVLHDNDVNPPTGLNHCVIYDISATTTSLPANVDKAYAPATPAGSHTTHPFQTTSGAFGYSGPCPPAEHTYEFQLYALDVATLTDLGQTSDADDGVTAIKAHMLAVTKLTAKYKKP